MSMKNSNGTIGNRTRHLPTCSAVPQPTAPPVPLLFKKKIEEMKAKQEIGLLAALRKRV